jgi:hypothetical protein
MLKASEISGDPLFAERAAAAGRYLESAPCRPMGATFLCRTNPQKDLCNGLIGQAWVIEALVAAGHHLRERSWTDLARELFLVHPFDAELGLWRIVNVDGSYRGFDPTFNHQLWFAACGSMIPDTAEGITTQRVVEFLDRAASVHLRELSRSGRIPHYVRGVSRSYELLKSLNRLRRPGRMSRARRELSVKEIGYHAFNLYGFALLKQNLPDHGIWASDGLRRSLRYVDTPEFVDGLSASEFAYSYNPTGFEVAFASQVLDGSESELEYQRRWIANQLALTMSSEGRMLTVGTTDPATLSARLYQATRLADLPLT